jgi:hypothetical protein
MLLHFLGSRVNTDPRSRQTQGFTTQSNSIFELHRGKLLNSVEYYRSHKINIEVICVLPVAGLAASDAMLFLWAINPMLPEALRYFLRQFLSVPSPAVRASPSLLNADLDCVEP